MEPPPVHYVTTSDGYSIAYAVSGKGRPFLLLPGAFEHVQLAWQYPKLSPWLEGLSARFQLIQLDERGAGMSTRGLKEDHALEDYLLDLEAVVQKLNPEPITLFATTTRSPTAVQFAVKHPDRVFALVLGPGGLSGAARPTQSAFFNTLPEADWGIFLRSLASQYQAPADVARSAELLNQSFEQHDFAQRMRVALLGLSGELLTQLTTPTLILHPRDYWGGDLSSSTSMQNAQLARATFTLIDGSFALGDADQGIRAIEAFLADLAVRDGLKPGENPPTAGLSQREIEVLRLLAAGRSNQEIADELVISRNTVIRHVSNIFAKTGVTNRVEAAQYATRSGLI